MSSDQQQPQEENPLDRLRQTCDKIFNIKEEITQDDTNVEKILSSIDSEKNNSLEDFLVKNLDKKTHNLNDNIEKIKILLNYLKETAIAAFGTPHDFHTKLLTKKLYEYCKEVYLKKHEGKIDRDFIVIVETKIEQAYNVANTERLAEIWDEANDAVFDYINNKYNIKLPTAFLHETKRRNDNDDDDANANAVDDGRIKSVLEKLNLKDAEGIRLFIDTANKAMLSEFHNLNGKLVKLDETVAVIDAAKQPTLKNAQKVYDNDLTEFLEKEPVCIGDICFCLREFIHPLEYLEDFPLDDYPIVIFKGDKPIMYCQKEAGVTILSNLLELIPGAEKYGFKGRSKTQKNIFKCCLLSDSLDNKIPVEIDEKFFDENENIESTNPEFLELLIKILLICKAAGDKCPIDFLDILKLINPDLKGWFMTGDKLAAKACKELTAYNRPNGRTDFYIPPYFLQNPDEELIKKLFNLKNSLDMMKEKKYMVKIFDYIIKLYDITDINSPATKMALYMIMLAEKYNGRIHEMNKKINEYYDKLMGFIDDLELEIVTDEYKVKIQTVEIPEIMEEMRSDIPKLTITATEIENVIYSKIDDIPTGYDIDLNKVFDVVSRKNIVRKIIKYDELPDNTFNMNNYGNIKRDPSINKTIYSNYNPPQYKFVSLGVFKDPIYNDKGKFTSEYYYYNIIQIEDTNNKNKIIQQFAIEAETPNTKETTKDSKPTSDTKNGRVIEESIVSGLPEMDGKLIIITDEVKAKFEDTFREVLDQYTIVDFLDYILRWPNNRFIIPVQGRGRTNVVLIENTITFYQHIMTALYILIDNTGAIEDSDKKSQVIQEEVFDILLNFVKKNIDFYKNHVNYKILEGFILDRVLGFELFTGEFGFELFNISFDKKIFSKYLNENDDNQTNTGESCVSAKTCASVESYVSDRSIYTIFGQVTKETVEKHGRNMRTNNTKNEGKMIDDTNGDDSNGDDDTTFVPPEYSLDSNNGSTWQTNDGFNSQYSLNDEAMNVVPTNIDSPIFDKVVPKVVPNVLPKYDDFSLRGIPKKEQEILRSTQKNLFPKNLFPNIELLSDNVTSPVNNDSASFTMNNNDSASFTMNNNDSDDDDTTSNKKRPEFKEEREAEKASPPRSKSRGGSKNITKKHNKKTRKSHRNKKTKKTQSRKKRYSKKNKYRNKST